VSTLTAEFRAILYKFLSLAFSYPSDKCLEDIDKVVDDLASKSSLYMERLNISELYLTLKNETKELVGECTRILGGVNGNGICNPYERDYIPENKDKVLGELRKEYEEAGFTPDSDSLDHISTELNFAYYVLTSNKISDEKRNSVLVKFLKNHALKWFEKFANCVESNAKLEFYKLAARTLLKLLEIEKEYLGIK